MEQSDRQSPTCGGICAGPRIPDGRKPGCDGLIVNYENAALPCVLAALFMVTRVVRLMKDSPEALLAKGTRSAA